MALRPWLRPSSIASRNGSHQLMDGTDWGDSCSESINSTPNPVVTAFSLAGFAVLAFAFPFVERFSGLGLTVLAGFCRVRPGGHPIFVGRFCRRSPSPRTRRAHFDPGRFQVGSGGLPTHPGLLLDAPQGPFQPAQGYDLLFFASLKTLLIPTKATALRRNQRPRASFPLAGFEVTLIGRFWVTPEDINGVTFHRLDLESHPFITSKSKAIGYPRRYVAHARCRVDGLFFK